VKEGLLSCVRRMKAMVIVSPTLGAPQVPESGTGLLPFLRGLAGQL
jgi:hypothetical protein